MKEFLYMMKLIGSGAKIKENKVHISLTELYFMLPAQTIYE
ncbi:hypothetical protein [Bacillus sp. MYb209]|nr:hypothetical protein [Bacillus sp. MYb209]